MAKRRTKKEIEKTDREIYCDVSDTLSYLSYTKEIDIKDKVNWFNTQAMRSSHPNAEQTLRLYLDEKVYSLLSSREELCLAHDSELHVYLSNPPKEDLQKVLYQSHIH